MKTLPVAALLLPCLLTACVPEPLEADCPSCGAVDAACPSCDGCGGGECGPCADVPAVDSTPPDGADASPCPAEAPPCSDEGVCGEAAVAPACWGGEWVCPLWDVPGWEPAEVSCDGVDNDCDGTTDQGLSPPAGTCPAQGVCAAAAALCAGGAWDCGLSGLPGYEDAEIICDGADNDCDGDVDEGTCACVPGSRACPDGDPDHALACPATGLAWETEPCPGGAACMGEGECTATGVMQVNQETVDAQGKASASRLDNGIWIAVWQTGVQDGSMAGVAYRVMSSAGGWLDDEAIVNLHTGLDQIHPVLAPLAAGRALLAWESVDQLGAFTSVMGRVVPGEGPSPWGEVLLSPDLTSDALLPSAAAAGGVAAVAWEGGPAGDRDVLVRRVDAETGLPLAGIDAMSAGIAGQNRAPVLVAAGEGFAVLWEKGAPLTEIYGRSLASDGTPGPILQVHSQAGDALGGLRAAGTDQHVLVLWSEVGSQVVAGRALHADLTAEGLPGPAPLPTAGPDVAAYAVAADGAGGFAVAWQDLGSDPPAIRLRPWDALAGLGGPETELVVATGEETPLTVPAHLALAGGPGGKLLVLWNAAAAGGNGTSEVFARFVQAPQGD